MRDSTKTLKFNPNRDLGFDQTRGVDFKTRRSLNFDTTRALLFNVDRDLEIRKRGVVFRGYICPICKASVAEDAPRCDDCGIDFVPNKPKTGKKVVKAAEKKDPKTRGKAPRNKKFRRPRKTFQCPVCGQALYVGTNQCPSCEIVF